MKIHPSAIVASENLSRGVEVGPFAVVGEGVTLGANTRVRAHTVVEGHTIVGEDCVLGPYAVIGTPAQVRGASIGRGQIRSSGRVGVRMGDRVVIREFATVHGGTLQTHEKRSQEDEGWTRIGSDSLIMAYSHVAHDCVLGERVVLSNAATLAGHVWMADDVTLGGRVAVHQFVRLGRFSFLAAGAYVERDVPPFCRAAGDRAMLVGLNSVALKRAGFDEGQRRHLSVVYRSLFRGTTTLEGNMQQARERWPDAPLALEMMEFISTSERGICRPRNRRES